ncbi:pyridoxamine 5'-phosphate oxidase family protein [Candidatus Saccharibacteria bacterium]|nr:pyridoxamine 5'-phosphate oxidase family protein [Candidatus Saccharibacteria bacterium]
MDDSQKVREFLARQRHMVVSVVLPNGKPWSVPVKIQECKGLSFAWDSRQDTEHSKAIAMDPNIAILMYDTTKDDQIGVNIVAVVDKIVENGDYAHYYATVQKIFLNDEKYIKREVHL